MCLYTSRGRIRLDELRRLGSLDRLLRHEQEDRDLPPARQRVKLVISGPEFVPLVARLLPKAMSSSHIARRVARMLRSMILTSRHCAEPCGTNCSRQRPTS